MAILDIAGGEMYITLNNYRKNANSTTGGSAGEKLEEKEEGKSSQTSFHPSRNILRGKERVGDVTRARGRVVKDQSLRSGSGERTFLSPLIGKKKFDPDQAGPKLPLPPRGRLLRLLWDSESLKRKE